MINKNSESPVPPPRDRNTFTPSLDDCKIKKRCATAFMAESQVTYNFVEATATDRISSNLVEVQMAIYDQDTKRVEATTLQDCPVPKPLHFIKTNLDTNEDNRSTIPPTPKPRQLKKSELVTVEQLKNSELK